ncbi:hypothetical protein Q31a_13200 [Aureliella helgolandensis]|uniref:Uncharacterized protein n=1 Tax=Aureliella helgolandensis TaxID=2527968 RepID=A0A518G345_9BACT|nr:hypothetical protein Q31a_13200 [Aureliella helgolandensis]
MLRRPSSKATARITGAGGAVWLTAMAKRHDPKFILERQQN